MSVKSDVCSKGEAVTIDRRDMRTKSQTLLAQSIDVCVLDVCDLLEAVHCLKWYL